MTLNDPERATTPPPTLAAFIEARLAEDEATAQAVLAFSGSGARQPLGRFDDPRRVLAEVEAKRAIVALHEEYGDACNSAALSWRDHNPWPCPTLRHLAAIWQDHPDYREEWRP